MLFCSFFCMVSMAPGWKLAEASRLEASGSASTIRKHCDMCFSPSIMETQPPSTLQPYRPHRPHHPRGSRPHRLPSGRYRIAPDHRQTPPSRSGRIPRRHLPTNQPIDTIDGDTLRVGPDRVRLRGINTPELGEPGGEAARERLAELLQQGPIRIVPYGQDVYGRTIADVFVNGRNVAEVLRQEGHAKAG